MAVIKKPATTTAVPTKAAVTPVKAATTVTKPAAAPAKAVATPAKANTVVKNNVATKPAVAPAKAVATPAKAPVGKNSVAKAAPAKAPAAPAKASVAKKDNTAKGGKMKLMSNSKTAPKSFEIKVGGQATQEAFTDRFHKRLIGLGYNEVTKENAKLIQKAYSETLKEVTNIASYQDTASGIFYARRLINTRVTNPPKAAEGLQTLMLLHPELKVRKLLTEETNIKFFGQLSEDGTTFITSEGDEIVLDEAEKTLMAEYTKGAGKSAKKASAKVADETADEEGDVVSEEEELVDEEVADDAEEAVEELEEELADEEAGDEEAEEELFEEEE